MSGGNFISIGGRVHELRAQYVHVHVAIGVKNYMPKVNEYQLKFCDFQ